MALTKLPTNSLGQGISIVNWDSSVKTANFTATSNSGYWVDTTSNAITITLPASPSNGDIVVIADYAENFNTNKVTVDPNSLKIKGGTVNGSLSTAGQVTSLIYSGATKGWLLTDSGLASQITQPTYIIATGGTITTSGDYKYHAFTTSGTFTVTQVGSADGSNTLEYIVVGGGGSGGTGSIGVGAQSNGAGGGAGGIQHNASFSPSVTSYTITIGGGGAGVAPQNNGGNAGTASSGFSVTAGAGAANSGMTGGASGSPQSKSGGSNSTYAGGSGAGAGANGNTPGGNTQVIGGIGLQYSNFSQFGAEGQPQGSTITLNPTPNGYFAGGGAGGGSGGSPGRAAGGGGAGYLDTNDSAGRMAGVPNTGGGGAGGYAESQRSGNGGSGIVIVRYKYQ